MDGKITEEEMNKYRNISIFNLLGGQNIGRDIHRCCPFHKEKTPSFVLYSDNHYHCFGFGKHGKGAIDFCRDMGYSFKESLEELKAYL